MEMGQIPFSIPPYNNALMHALSPVSCTLCNTNPHPKAMNDRRSNILLSVVKSLCIF